MPLSLHVDGPRWRRHLRSVVEASPGIVPVAKGNGYGFGVGRLARRAQWLGADLLAVGTYAEVPEVANRFDGDVLVLEPWRPFLRTDVLDPKRLIHTVGRTDDVAALGEQPETARVVLEGLTSMHRHGLRSDDLSPAGGARGVHVEGLALHLPLGTGHVAEVERWLDRDAGVQRCFVSHVNANELAELAGRHPGVEFRPRVGTDLWLGDRTALSARSTVLDVHRVGKGDRVGYRQRKIGKDGHVLVLSGGTAHGIAMEAPAPASSSRQRAVSVAKGGLEAVGRALSPFVIGGKQRWFVEPPHMQVSMVFVPSDVPCPEPGDEVDVQVRFTTTTFDRVDVTGD
jgi:alanine racemase